MPFGIHKHSNRSKQALNDSAVQGINTPSSGSGAASPVPGSHLTTDETRSNQPQAFTPQQSHADVQSYVAVPSPAPEIDPRTQQRSGDLPTRSQSTRYPSAYQQQQAQQPQAGGSVENLVEARRHQQQDRERALQALQTPALVETRETKKKGNIFERMRNSTSRTSEPKTPTSAQSSYNTQSGLTRRLSRRQENPPGLHTAQQGSAQEKQRHDWQSIQGSRSHLPSPQEGNEDDSGLDPYLVTEPRQELAHTPVTQEASQYQIIRPVQDDSDNLAYSTDDDKYLQFEAQQQHLRNQLHHNHQRSESNSHNYYSPQDLAHAQHQGNFPGGNLVAGDPYRQQNPETVSQLSYDSPIEQREEQRPVSVQSNNGQSPTGLGLQRAEYPNRTTSIPTGRPLSTYAAMAPQAGAGQQNRRPEPKQNLQVNQGQGALDTRDGPPPNYSRGQFQGNQPQSGGVSPLPPTGGAPGPNYRGGPPQREYSGVGGGEQGRSTPPPAPNDRDVNDAYKELLTKYKKVKGLYFDKTAQVESLQNTLANQRLSQSRTSLDDSEYMTRFQRLDGATTNLAFNIRKGWRQIPAWLSQYVNQDALKIGKQEMTAVGRACITKFLVDEIFNRTFHPGLEGDFSTSLKSIEQNIRRFSPALNNQEESDALTAKVVQWRLATLEGLKDSLNSPESEDYKNQFIRVATTNLTASLINLLNEPIPVGIEDSAHMIVELAVSIAANLPLESRDISIVYPMPGDLLQTFIMKVESAIPLLENPGVETISEGDTASTNSGEKEDASSKEGEKGEGNKLRKEKTKSTGGMLQAMMGGNSGGGGQNKKPVQGQGQAESSSDGKKISMEDGAQKVRFAGFVGVEVRGRQVLGKAPVWTVGS